MSEDTVKRLMGLADAYAFPKSFVISGDGITASATDMEAARSTLESALREALSAFPVELEQPEQPKDVGVPASPSRSPSQAPPIADAACDDDEPGEPWERDDERTFDIIMLCGGHDVPRDAVSGWTDEQCQQAEDWAAREHFAASDNDDVERVPMPQHVKDHPPTPGLGGLWERT